MPTEFRFNFGSSESEPAVQACDAQTAESQVKEVLPADERHAPGAMLEQMYLTPSLCIWKGRVSSQNAADLLGQSSLKDSDLLRGQYEGGFKLWEGATDLSLFLLNQYRLDESMLVSPTEIAPLLKGKRVLELGCGHGLPGLVAALAGADVHFQDYNGEVLSVLTIPNVQANVNRLPAQRHRGELRYFAGSWQALPAFLKASGLLHSYDIVLTAETVYDSVSSLQMYQCLIQCLASDGVAYVAAKTYYFGVGGGSLAFKQQVEEQVPMLMSVRSVAAVDDGMGNKREILELRLI